MMEFGSPAERIRAMVLAARYLPRLVRTFEDGVREAGLEIVNRGHYRDEAGAVVPVIVARSGEITFRLELRNAFEDLLAVDREAHPVRLDPRLDDDAYAAEKLEGIVRDRLALVQAVAEGGIEGAQERIDALGDRFEWLRSAFIDAEKEDDDE